MMAVYTVAGRSIAAPYTANIIYPLLKELLYYGFWTGASFLPTTTGVAGNRADVSQPLAALVSFLVHFISRVALLDRALYKQTVIA